jgi:CO/xanthine dehydrogenase FAD-binding subunit
VSTPLPSPLPDFARPATLPEALELLALGGWRLLAGGTDLYPGAGSRLPGPVLDVSGIAELAGITRAGNRAGTRAGEVRIGAATSWATIAAADLPPALHALQAAARVVGGRQVQVAGTIGGNLCNASPAADGVPPLLVLEAEVELWSHAGARRLRLADFILGPRKTALRPGEVLTAVVLPEAALRGRSAFVKLGARSHLVISIAMVAARVAVDRGRVAGVALAVGSCSGVAQRLPVVEAALVGAPVAAVRDRIRAADVAAALSPIDDVRATAGYRLEAAVELLCRAVAEAVG